MFRYQNQRHPSNKFAGKANVTQSSIGEQTSTASCQVSSTVASSMKREPLLPTPPSNQMVKLDTSLTCKKQGNLSIVDHTCITW